MRPQIFDLMDEMGWVGSIYIEESQGYPEAAVVFMDDREAADWMNT